MANRQLTGLLKLARQQLAQNNPKLAIGTIREALTLAPDDVDIHEFAASIYYEAYRVMRKKAFLKPAKSHVETALQLNPGAAHSYSTAALIYYGLGKPKQAKPAIQKALELAPYNASYYRIAAVIHQKAYRWQKDTTPKFLAKALELDPSEVDTLVCFGSYYYFNKGNSLKAEEYTTQALGISPSHMEALILMGHILYRRKDIAAAKEHAMIAIGQNPDDYEALKLLCLASTRRFSLTGASYRTNIWLSKPGRWIIVLAMMGLFRGFGFLFYAYIRESEVRLEKRVKKKYMQELHLKKSF